MNISRKRLIVAIAALAVALLHDVRHSFVLASVASPESPLRPRRVDERRTSLEWMPDVAERLRLLERLQCREPQRRLHGDAAPERLEPARGTCEAREILP